MYVLAARDTLFTSAFCFRFWLATHLVCTDMRAFRWRAKESPFIAFTTASLKRSAILNLELIPPFHPTSRFVIPYMDTVYRSIIVRASPRHPWLVSPARPSVADRSAGSTRFLISSKRHPSSPSPGDGDGDGDGESKARLRLAFRNRGRGRPRFRATFPVAIRRSSCHALASNPNNARSSGRLNAVAIHCLSLSSSNSPFSTLASSTAPPT
jgi:hypothetical protein